MFRPAFRIASPAVGARLISRTPVARRFVSTAPPHQKSRSWKSSAARWGLAGALVYYYNTATAFAEEPAYAIHSPPETSRETETYPTVASVSEQRRAQSRPQPVLPSKETQSATVAVADAAQVAPGSPEALEEEASEQGAFNEETGEINWDCPCLGGMAYGPCGEQFRAAFSCFVFSKEEPKGVDCIEHFKTMQNCFREHPEVYGAELEDDDASSEGVEGQAIEGQPAPVSAEPEPTPQAASLQAAGPEKPATDAHSPQESQLASSESQQRVEAATEPVRAGRGDTSGTDEDLPKVWHDARSASPSQSS